VQKKITNDSEFALYRVLLLRKGYDWFKHGCREKGYAVRDFSLSELNEQDETKQIEELKKTRSKSIKKIKIIL